MNEKNSNKMYFGISLFCLGIIYLVVDLGFWDFWDIQWWTALLIVAGIYMILNYKIKKEHY